MVVNNYRQTDGLTDSAGLFHLWEWEQDVACGKNFHMVQWVVGLSPRGGPIELFLIPASAPRLV